MNTSVTAFIFEGSAVRTVMRDGEPWFVLADVCRVLGSENPSKAASALDGDEKGQEIFPTPGGPQRLSVVSESGLYTVSLRSHGATTSGTVQHRFRRWLTSEVLPAIRKTGGYLHAAPDEPAEVVMARALLMADATIKRQQEQLDEDERMTLYQNEGRTGRGGARHTLDNTDVNRGKGNPSKAATALDEDEKDTLRIVEGGNFNGLGPVWANDHS